MRYVSIDSLEPGQYLGKAIFSSNGTVLLNEGVQLTVYMISTLKRIGVTYVYVKDELFEDIEMNEIVSEETKRAIIGQMSEMFEALRSGKTFDTRSVSLTIDQLLEEVMRNKDVMIHLSDIRSEENSEYLHALNVCTMASLMGMNMGFNQIQLKELAVGALLHDIGKVGSFDDSDESDRRRHHTWRGFETLKLNREFSLLSAHAAFQHHEHVDGTGVPRGISGEDIHPYAKIVSVANTYDNLVSGQHELGGKAMMPHEACERLMAMAGRELDKDVLIEFLRIVSVYPNGTSVRLTNHETGVVVGQHRGLPSRPIVRIVKRDEHDIQVKEIDLAQHPTLFIEAVLN